ncbi:MAG: nuclear transport factor 2 family protein [Saprospiraceae bacterium]
MKSFYSFLVVLLPFLSVAQTDSDEAAIHQTFHDETAAYYQKDFELWASHWVKDETVFHGWNNKDGTYTIHEGWKQLGPAFEKQLKGNPEPVHPDFEYKNVKITVVGDLAYVTHDEYPSDASGEKFTHVKGFKMLRKVAGKWKLVSVCSYWNYEYNLAKGDF